MILETETKFFSNIPNVNTEDFIKERDFNCRLSFQHLYGRLYFGGQIDFALQRIGEKLQLNFTVDHAQSTVLKKMATGSFTHNSLRTKTLKTLIKTHRKLLKTSNLANTILLVKEIIS